jgi:hypothetical protein
MRKVAQRLCQCAATGKLRRATGFAHDDRSDMEVCGGCGFPSEYYYLALRSAQPPNRPIKYSKGFSEAELEWRRERNASSGLADLDQLYPAVSERGSTRTAS